MTDPAAEATDDEQMAAIVRRFLTNLGYYEVVNGTLHLTFDDPDVPDTAFNAGEHLTPGDVYNFVDSVKVARDSFDLHVSEFDRGQHRVRLRRVGVSKNGYLTPDRVRLVTDLVREGKL